ncbi:MAG TPA: hypothetical protein P5048_04130 [Chlamydiales bacterium]|nr:hypothetical protein [Chlamydiales bacterium]
MNRYKFQYLLIRFSLLPFSILPLGFVRKAALSLSIILYPILSKLRKRTLSNLALAKDLNLSNREIEKLAKDSFKNLIITMLEYPFLNRKKAYKKILCKNPEIAQQLYNEGKGIIFFCGHQANWEALFIDGTTRMKGIAIGKPIKNRPLYHWILSIRQKNGGRIINPNNALKESLKALRKGIFLGIVGDQAVVESSYHYPFMGRKAWTSNAPALLAYKTQSPIIVANTLRTSNGYEIHYSDPIFPNLNNSTETEVPYLMNLVMKKFEDSIKQRPAEWMWQHNRWKQQSLKLIYKRFRYDCILIILSGNINEDINILETFKQIYPNELLIVYTYKNDAFAQFLNDFEFHFFENTESFFQKDYRPKLLFNFGTIAKIEKYFKKLSVIETFDMNKIKNIALKNTQNPLSRNSDYLTAAILRTIQKEQSHATL